ncbi:MAG: TAXI family TRAP transporter solute-binding subunit [Alphaproteobacteria bacterium]|nr:TAXI family TRAP transporter solute-binding subunit [Alphaproteobacteria bacterium]
MNKRRVLALAFATALVASGPAHATVYSIGTNPQGSQYFFAATSIAKAIDEKLKLQVRVQPMGGSSTYIPLVNRQELDFALGNVDDMQGAYKGAGNFVGKPNPNIRLMSVMFPLAGAILVPADSPVRKIEDLKGLRMPSGYNSQLTMRVIQEGVLATGGLSPADVREVPVVNGFAGVEALAAGRVDAATITPGVAQVQKAHVDLSARGGVRFIPINTDPAAVERMRKIMPTRPLVYDPAPHFVGIIAPTALMGYSTFLFTHDKSDPELVYNVMKILHGNQAALAASAPILNQFEPHRMSEINEVPYHPGAIKFLTEIGQWPPKD